MMLHVPLLSACLVLCTAVPSSYLAPPPLAPATIAADSYGEAMRGDCYPDSCYNGGTCDNKKDAYGYTCSCPQGFDGSRCEKAVDTCNPNPCLNEGYCVVHGYDAVCKCPYGVTGDRCETELNPCEPAPCENGGICKKGNYQVAYVCECPFGFFGRNCELDPCANIPCQNNGICTGVRARTGPTFTCQCSYGFGGYTCDKDTEPCEPNPCNNGGVCRVRWKSDGYDHDYQTVCLCPCTHTGDTCDIFINPCEPNPCLNNATCRMVGGYCDHSQFACTCHHGFEGNKCERKTGHISHLRAPLTPAQRKQATPVIYDVGAIDRTSPASNLPRLNYELPKPTYVQSQPIYKIPPPAAYQAKPPYASPRHRGPQPVFEPLRLTHEQRDVIYRSSAQAASTGRNNPILRQFPVF
ncbi:PREDICTED: delta-like protein C [Priapulus caudatus]|uniref:Delta-like protein C n=1 Tax=Priapulus caudatus TaxID=37621 RepID=A0ABM1ECT6_PRICU|nr:PREDICTED: delta-like protein C [Priapulus caudatus]